MGISGRIAKTFLTSQLTPLIALMAALMGLFAILVTPREEEPQINVTMANVMIAYPGASAKDVAQTVATPAEQVLSQIAGVDHVYSVSRPGMAVITVQFKVGAQDDPPGKEGLAFITGQMLTDAATEARSLDQILEAERILSVEKRVEFNIDARF